MIRLAIAAVAALGLVGCDTAPEQGTPGNAQGTTGSAPGTPGEPARTAEGNPDPVVPQVTIDGVALETNPVECRQGDSWSIYTVDETEAHGKARLTVEGDNVYGNGEPAIYGDGRPWDVPPESLMLAYFSKTSRLIQWSSDPDVAAVRPPWVGVTTSRDGNLFTFTGELQELGSTVSVRVECNGWRDAS
jgi:hypothetical protein